MNAPCCAGDSPTRRAIIRERIPSPVAPTSFFRTSRSAETPSGFRFLQSGIPRRRLQRQGNTLTRPLASGSIHFGGRIQAANGRSLRGIKSMQRSHTGLLLLLSLSAFLSVTAPAGAQAPGGLSDDNGTSERIEYEIKLKIPLEQRAAVLEWLQRRYADCSWLERDGHVFNLLRHTGPATAGEAERGTPSDTPGAHRAGRRQGRTPTPPDQAEPGRCHRPRPLGSQIQRLLAEKVRNP